MVTKIDVALTPPLLGDPHDKVCVLVDVLRASSSLAVMFAQGIEEVVVAGTVEEARSLSQKLGSHYLLCGEEGSLPLPDFDHGNSPSQFSRLGLAGKRAILATTNCGKALAELSDAFHVLVGSLLNATAIAKGAFVEATSEREIVIICAGERGGLTFSLADTIGAGAIIAALAGLVEVELSDAAEASLALYGTYQGDVASILAKSAHGRGLVALGLGGDVAFCAQVDLLSVVPRLHKLEGGNVVLRV